MARRGPKRHKITQYGSQYRIDDLMLRQGMTPSKLAEIAGVHLVTISRIARGERLGSPKRLAKIAQALRVKVPELYREYDGDGGDTTSSDAKIAA